MANFIDALKWRYATKQFDPSKKLSDAQLATILEAIRLSPTSYGLQFFKAFVVTNPEVRAKLRAAAWNQSQLTDASQIIVFAVPNALSAADADALLELTAKTRGVALESLKGYSDMLKGSISSRTPEQNKEWAARQAYIALGVALSAAAVEGIDSTPMEGFDPKQFDEILGLSKLGWSSVVTLALGTRSSQDGYAKLAKVRFPKEKLVVEVK